MDQDPKIIICDLCYKTINVSECGNFENDILELLDVIFSNDKVNEIKNINDPKICKMCHKNIIDIFDFISKCGYTEDILTPYIEMANSNFDLKEIGKKENMFAGMKLTDIDAVCRLCFKPIQTDKIILNNAINEMKLQHLFETNLLRVNLNILAESYICDSCLTCLKIYSELTKMASAPKIKAEMFEEFSEETSFAIGKCENNEEHLDIEEESVDLDFIKIETDTSQNGTKHINKDGVFLICYHCSKELRSKKSLINHIRYIHGGQKRVPPINKSKVRFKCEICSYKSDQKNKLERHMLVHNNTVPKYECAVCDYKTNYKENLKKHMIKHDDNPELFSCDKCPYITKHKGYMKIHKATHEDPGTVKKYKCSLCTYETIHQGNLIKQHMKTHKRDETKEFECNKCEFKTHYKAHFINHQKVHKDFKEVQTFHCDSCSFKTKHKTSIVNHVKLHQSSANS